MIPLSLSFQEQLTYVLLYSNNPFSARGTYLALIHKHVSGPNPHGASKALHLLDPLSELHLIGIPDAILL